MHPKSFLGAALTFLCSLLVRTLFVSHVRDCPPIGGFDLGAALVQCCGGPPTLQNGTSVLLFLPW